MEFDKKMCPVVDVDGFIEKGKQFDIEVNLPEDNRNVIYGLIKDCYGEPVKDAVVKLIEVCKDERKPVSHTFTDKEGEFVFGPLCPDKFYEVQIWANKVKHYKICATCNHDGKCLKGVDMDQCDKDECCKNKWHKDECCKDEWHKDECHKDECCKDECHKDECHKDECHKDECCKDECCKNEWQKNYKCEKNYKNKM